MSKGRRSYPLENLQSVLLERATPVSCLAWSEVFGNEHPVEVEIGSGRGQFLVATATERCATNFVSLELDGSLARFVATRVAKRALPNAKVAKADARDFFANQVEPASVQAIHIYFPDPWWKGRHRKRRLLDSEFVDSCARALVPGGRLHLASDVEEIFTYSLRALCREPRLRPRVDSRPERTVASNFEVKARQKGREVFDVTFERLVDD